MVENKDIELTEHEAELYDRQIRLWGLESQKRAARVLLHGLGGLGAEIAKNIILSGVKSITLLDPMEVSELDKCSQFLLSKPDGNRAEASIQRAQVLNPMVEITADTERLTDKSEEFFKNFDVVILTEASVEDQLKVNDICRKNTIKFFIGDLWGMFGYSFTDLQEHSFIEDVAKHKIISKPNEKPKTELVTSTVKRSLTYPSLKSVLDYDYKSQSFTKKVKRTGPGYLVMKCLQQFRASENRDPDPKNRSEDYKTLLSIRNELANVTLVPDKHFEHVFAQISPAAAVIGGGLSQEIIKAIVQKEAPHYNVFIFDPIISCGFVEEIAT